MSRKTYTTTEAAQKVGVSRQTLFTWIKEGLVPAPKPVSMGQREIRFWRLDDIGRLKVFKGTLRRGPKSKKARRA